MDAPERAPLGAALALLLCLASLAGPWSPALVSVVVGFMTVVVAAGWPLLLRIQGCRGTQIIVGAAGIGAVLAALFTPDSMPATLGVLTVCAVSVFAGFTQQMLRSVRTDLTASLTGTVAGAFLTALASCWVLAQNMVVQDMAPGLVTVISATVAVTLLFDVLPFPMWARMILAMVAGVVTAVVLQPLLVGATLPAVTALGALSAVCTIGVHDLLDSVLGSEEPMPSLVVAAAPVATLGALALLFLSLAA